MRGLPVGHPTLDALCNTYERALVSMHKMPRIWIEFCGLLVDQRFVTRARRAFDRAICALPITQHDRIWQLYLVRPCAARSCSPIRCTSVQPVGQKGPSLTPA